MQDQKNMILAIVLSLGLIIVVQLAFETLGLNPPPPPPQQEAQTQAQDGTTTSSTAPAAPGGVYQLNNWLSRSNRTSKPL